MRCHYVAQASLQLLAPSNPPISASQSAGITRYAPLCLALQVFKMNGYLPKAKL